MTTMPGLPHVREKNGQIPKRASVMIMKKSLPNNWDFPAASNCFSYHRFKTQLNRTPTTLGFSPK